jgi:glycosyltransferase involved in cell wall biosynthesis
MPGRVLVVAYYFPPVGGIGVHRTLKYVTYLPRSGWQPVVVTARNPGEPLRDEAAARNLPTDLVVERAFSPEPAKLRRGLGSALRRLRPGRRKPAAPPRTEPPAVQRAAKPGGRLWRYTGGIWNGLVRQTFFPDQQAGWALFAARSGLKAHRREPVDVVYSSSLPVACHLAAGIVAKRTGLPWVADFRDPWIGNAFIRLPRWQRPLQRRLERWIVRRADRIVFASDGFLQTYLDRYPWAADKLLVIPNGYDRNDFSPRVLAAMEARRSRGTTSGVKKTAGPTADGRRFKLVYGGAIYGNEELEIFLDGLELLLNRRPELRDRLEVEFIGWLTVHNQQVAARYSAPERLGSVVRYSGFVPHAEALERFAQADALFHIIGSGPEKWRIASGKLTEYVGLDCQIVAFVPEGSAREFLRGLDWGILADPTPEGVASGIEQVLATPAPSRRADPEGRYDRVNLAARLAAVLDAVRAGRTRAQGS